MGLGKSTQYAIDGLIRSQFSKPAKGVHLEPHVTALVLHLMLPLGASEMQARVLSLCH